MVNLLFPGGEGGLGKIIILSDVENESYVSVDINLVISFVWTCCSCFREVLLRWSGKRLV